MGILRSINGMLRIQITSASPSDMLTAVNNCGIALFDVSYVDDLCVCASVFRCDYKTLIKLLTGRGDAVKVLHRDGLVWSLFGLKKRPVLLFGTMVLLVLSLYLPTRILFVEVEGNESIATELILDKAEQCGVRFGASRRELRSERMKNALLTAIPQLQWAGINTTGCVAVISVQERSTVVKKPQTHPVSSIVAARDGIIQQITVLQGNALCKVGDAVKEGQTLVSGYTDCGITIKAAEAKAEIYAQTIRELSVITPSDAAVRGELIGEETHYSLRIGKKVIKLYKDSGISVSSCVKIYSEAILTLPGGFQLPIALLSEQQLFYNVDSYEETREATSWLENYAQSYLFNQMLAGQILSAETTTEEIDNACVFYGKYDCLEMIGRVRSEEIVQ